MNPDKDSPSSQPSTPNRRVILYLAIIVCLVGGGILAIVFAKPAYRWVKAKQAASLAEKAQVLIAEEKWRDAAAALREANQLSSREPKVIRALAEFYSHADLRKQRQMLYTLYDGGDHTAADLRDLIVLELRFRNPLKAHELTSDLLKTFGDSADNLKTAIQVATVQEDVLQAEEYLRKLVVLEPEDGDIRLDLARTLLESNFEEKSRGGWDEVYKLVSRTDDAGLEALRLIVRRAPFYPGRIDEIYELVQKHPNATKADKLGALGWRYESSASSRERAEILEKAINEMGSGSHAENRSFYFWLNLVGEHERVLSLLTREDAYSTPGLLTVYITALLQSEKYGEIEEILEPSEDLEETSEVAFIKAQCALYLEMSTTRVRDYLQESYELALLDKRSEMLGHVARLAHKQGLTELAETVYEAMSRVPETSLQAYQELLTYRQRRGDLAGMRMILREVREKIPHDFATLKKAVYWDLLQGVNMEAAYEDIREFSERLPSDEEGRLILSFARYRLGDVAAALKELENCSVENLSPSYRAVYAAIVGASGDAHGAVIIAEKLPRTLLLKEEIQLVSKWLP